MNFLQRFLALIINFVGKTCKRVSVKNGELRGEDGTQLGSPIYRRAPTGREGGGVRAGQWLGAVGGGWARAAPRLVGPLLPPFGRILPMDTLKIAVIGGFGQFVNSILLRKMIFQQSFIKFWIFIDFLKMIHDNKKIFLFKKWIFRNFFENFGIIIKFCNLNFKNLIF